MCEEKEIGINNSMYLQFTEQYRMAKGLCQCDIETFKNDTNNAYNIMEIIDTFNDLFLTRFQCFFWPKFLRKTVFKTQRVSVTWPKLLQLTDQGWELDRYVFSPWLHK